MAAVLAPELFQQFANAANTAPLVGGKLFTYIAGTSTKQATYMSSVISAPNQNSNPIILDSAAAANVWLDPALIYKFVLAPANDTDPPTSAFRTIDNIYPELNAANLTVVSPVVLPYGPLMTPNIALGTAFYTIVTDGNAFTINNPTNLLANQSFSIQVLNYSAGAMGAITWGSIYRLAGAFTTPASGYNRSVAFLANGGATAAYEKYRNAADVPN